MHMPRIIGTATTVVPVLESTVESSPTAAVLDKLVNWEFALANLG